MMPASTRVSTRLPPATRLMAKAAATVTMEKQKAERVIIRVEAPRRMASAAPKAAPLEAPKISGEAMGLWNTPWKAAPAADREQPTRHAITIRGRRMFTTTVSICAVQVRCRTSRPVNSSKNRANRIFTTCAGGTP